MPAALKTIFTYVFGIAGAIILVFLLLWGIGWGYHFYVEGTIDAQIADALPASVYEQKEFPKNMVDSQMRSCLLHARMNEHYNPDHSAKLCACAIQKRVQRFKLLEFNIASGAHWDSKVVPDAVAKNAAINTECEQALQK